MIKKSGNNSSARGDLPSTEGHDTAGWTTAIFALLVLMGIPPLPRAFSQPLSGRDDGKQSLRGSNPRLQHSSAGARQQTTKGGQSGLLPYDIRLKTPVSQTPKGFHNSKELLPRPVATEASNIQRTRSLKPSEICPLTITQSTNQTIVTNSVACSDPGVGTLESHYWRAFNMATFAGGRAYDITSVEFGIEQALSLFGTDQPLTVNLYVNQGSPFPEGDWQSNLLASSGKIRIPNQEDTLFNVPLTATVPAGALELVMEVLSPDQTVEHNFFIIGSNPDPETGPSYLSAPDCSNPDPVATRCIGFPDMHYVFNVNGSCAGGGTTPTPTPTPSCTPMAITGSIDNNDPTQNDRLNRGVISGCCGTIYPCQIFGDGQPHH